MSTLRLSLRFAAIVTIVVLTILSFQQELDVYDELTPSNHDQAPPQADSALEHSLRSKFNGHLSITPPSFEQTATSAPLNVEKTPKSEIGDNNQIRSVNNNEQHQLKKEVSHGEDNPNEVIQAGDDPNRVIDVPSGTDLPTSAPTQQLKPEIWLYWPSAIGRFGNQLWNYASYLGMYLDTLEKLNGTRTVKFVRSKDAGRDFEGLFENGLPPVIDAISSVPALQKERGYGKFEPFDMAKNACVPANYSGTLACLISRGYSYLQSFKYFENHTQEIRKALSWDSDYWNRRPKELWDEFLEAHREFEEAAVVVGIHVRRGDLVTHDLQYLRIPPPRYYESAMDYFDRKYSSSNVHFLVASEDKDWCRDAFRENPRVHILPDGAKPEDDMAILSTKSNHFIMGVGTYGWWSAWLTGGDVVYYGDGLDMDHDVNKGKVLLEDYYPADWVGLGDSDLSPEVWIVLEGDILSGKESEVLGVGRQLWLLTTTLGAFHRIRSGHRGNVKLYTSNATDLLRTELSLLLSSPTFQYFNVTTNAKFSSVVNVEEVDLLSNCTSQANSSFPVPVCLVSLDASSLVPSYRHFDGVECDLRCDLKVRDDVLERVESFWSSKGWHNLTVGGEAPVFVGVEMTNHTDVSQKYYRVAMMKMIDTFPSAVFVASCYDGRRCVEQLTNYSIVDAAKVQVLPEEMTEIERWALFSTKCQHMILNVDHEVGFGLDWWSAWWTNGTAIYLQPAVPIDEYYPPKWIAVDRSEALEATTDDTPNEKEKVQHRLTSNSLHDHQEIQAEPEIWLLWTAPVSSARFGNRIWIYASYLGMYFDAAKKYNGTRTIRLVRSAAAGTKLEGLFEQPFPPRVVALAKVSKNPERGYGIFEPFDISQHTCRPANYSGKIACVFSKGVSYLQSFRYFENNSDLVRDTLAWSQDFMSKRPKQLWDELLHEHDVLAGADVIVGIHIRRGDVLSNPSSSYVRTPLLSFYEAGMSFFNARYNSSSVQFLVASDDKAWCRRAFETHPTVHVLPDGAEPEVDMAILSTNSDHFIMSVGTFGWWAAWLTGGDVVYYKDAIDMEHPENKGKVILEDYYPNGWVPIGDDELPSEPEMWIIMEDNRSMEKAETVLVAEQLWFYASALGEFYRYGKRHKGAVKLFRKPSATNSLSLVSSILSTPIPETLEADIESSGFSIHQHLDSPYPDLVVRSCDYQFNLTTVPVCVADFDAAAVPPSFRYFSGAEAELRRDFQVREELKERSERFWRSEGFHNLTTPEGGIPVFVGLQVSVNMSLAQQYYRIATKRAKRMHPRSIFVAACDDMAWCVDNIDILSFEAPVHLLPTELNALQQWAVLATKCQHMVLAPDHRVGGDMGWWSAWWSSGNVFYLETDNYSIGYFPRKWIGLKEKELKASSNA